MELDGAPLVERDRHLKLLDETLDLGQKRQGGFVLIEGAFGTGKTALLRAVRTKAKQEGFTVLYARGSEFETRFRYGMIRQLFEHWRASASPEEYRDVLAGPAALAAPLFDNGGGGLSGELDVEQEQSLFRGLHHVLANLSQRGPVLVTLDDLHWSDIPSLRLFSYLGSRIDSCPILCCAVTVPLLRDEVAEFQRALLDFSSFNCLPVHLLSEDGVRQYLHSAVGSVSADAVRACYRATVGNPFFLHELVAELRSAPNPESISDPRLIARAGPNSVAHTVLRWIQHASEQHGDSAYALARALAVVGEVHTLSQLAGVAELTQAQAADAARVLRDVGLVEPGEPLRFAAPVVRNAVYNQLPHTYRYRAHYSAAQVLAENNAPPQQVAEHLLHAPPIKDSRDTEILIDAARAAFRERNHSSAVALYRRAMLGPVPEQSLPAVLAELGEAELRTGETQAVDRLRQAMDLTVDPVTHATIALKLSGVLSVTVRYKEALSVLEAAHDKLRGRHDALAHRLSTEITSIVELLPAIRPVAEDRLSSGRTDVRSLVSDAEAAYGALAQRASEALLSGRRAEHVVRLCEEALAHRTPVSSLDGGARAPWLIAFCLFGCGQYTEARAVLDDTIQEAEALGHTLASDDLRALRAYVSRHRGMLAEAETDATATLYTSPKDGSLGIGRPYSILTLIQLNIQRNQTDVAEHLFERYSTYPEPPRQALFLPLLAARGQLRTASGDIESGVREFLEVSRLLAEWGVQCPAFTPVDQAIHGLAALDRCDEARPLAAEHLAAARAFGAPPLVASALCAYARATEGSLSLNLLEEAVQVLEGSDAVPLKCSALVQYGSALRGAGHTAQARRRLRAAGELAEDMGDISLGRQARQELAALGSRTSATPRTGVFGLTPRERRVSALAAEGKRNQEIASILFVTVKTIEFHLSQVYRKLNITSRGELRDALTRD